MNGQTPPQVPPPRAPHLHASSPHATSPRTCTADHLRRTARIVFNPKRAYLTANRDHEIRIAFGVTHIKQPWLGLWVAKPETIIK